MLGDDIAAALPELRAQAESMMRDTCRITGVTRVWSDELLDYVETPTIVYEGKCRIRFGNVGVQLGEQGEQLFTVQDATLSLPIDGTTAVRKDHTVEMLTSATDPGLVGARFTIGSARRQSDATARRFPIKETQ